MVINLDNIKYIFQIPLDWYKKVHNACFKTYGEDYVKVDATDDGTNIISLDTDRLDETIEEKIDEKISELGDVKSVDGHEPDENGNVSFELSANRYVVTDADGHLTTTNAISAVQSIKIQGQTETFNPDSNGLATLNIKHDGIADWGDATAGFATPQSVEGQIQSHNFATQQGLNQLGTTVQGVIGNVAEHEDRITALEEWQGEEVQKDAETQSAIDTLKTTTQTQTGDISGLKTRVGNCEDDIADLVDAVDYAYSPNNPPSHSDIDDWNDATKNFCKYNNGGDTTTTGIAQFKNDTVSYLGRNDTKQAFVTIKGKAVSLIAQNGIPYRTADEDDIKWTADFVKLAKDQNRCRLIGVNREGNWSSVMNTSTTSQGIPFLGKEGGAGSTSSTLNMLTIPSNVSSDCLVTINKSGNVGLNYSGTPYGGIVRFKPDGTLNTFAPADGRNCLVVFRNGEAGILAPTDTTKNYYVCFDKGDLEFRSNILPFDQTGFVYNTHSGTTETISYKSFGTGENDVARGNHKHNANGTTASSSPVTVCTGISWNGTQLVATNVQLNFSNGIFVGTTALANTTINTVTYNPS